MARVPQSQAYPSLRPGAAVTGSGGRRKDMKVSMQGGFRLFVLPVEMIARELKCQQKLFGWNFGGH
jgi:hypothetical protein